MLSVHRHSKESNIVKFNIMSCMKVFELYIDVGNRTTYAAYQRGVTCLSLQSGMCLALVLGRLGPAVGVMESVELRGKRG